MTISRLAAVQELTKYSWAALKMLGDPGKRWTLGLLKRVKTVNDPLRGRNRKAYWSYEQYPQAAGGPFSESSNAFASANDEEAVELQMSPVDMHRTCGMSWQRFEQMKKMDSDQRALNFAKFMTAQMNAEKTKMVNMFEGGRGDNVGARAFEGKTSAVSATFKCAPQVPILFQRGDIVDAFNTTGETNDERLRGQDDTGNHYIGSTHQRVLNVTRDADTPSITLGSACSWTDDVVLTWATNPTLDAPYGIPNHLDNVSDGTFKWDSEDGTSSDHLDVYFGGTRSSNTDLECWVHNAETAELDIPLFSTGMAKSIDGNEGDPSVIDETVVFMNPRQWRRFVKQSLGAVRLTTSKLFLPGSGKTMNVPTLTGKGVKDMPIRTTYNIPDGFVAFLHHTRLRKVYSEPTWIEGTEGVWHLLPQASVAGHQGDFQAYLAYTLQTGLFLPRSSGVIWNLDTSVTV
jgi:hypothetical protein